MERELQLSELSSLPYGAGALGYRLGATSKELVAALLPLTTHKRYRVRIAAIQAIRDVMHQV